MNSVCRFVKEHLCSSNSEKLIEFTHVYISIFLSIFVVVIRVHSNANMDSRLLVFVFCQCVTIHIITKVALLLLLFTVVDDFELNRWHRFELLLVVVDLLERFIPLQTFSIHGNSVLQAIRITLTVLRFHTLSASFVR